MKVFFTTLLIGTYASIAYGGFLGGSSYSQATHSAPAYASSLQVTGTVAESHSQEASNALVNEPAPAHPEIPPEGAGYSGLEHHIDSPHLIKVIRTSPQDYRLPLPVPEIVRIFSQPKPAEHLQKVHVIQPEIVHFLRYKNQQPQALAPSLTAPVPLKIVKIVNTPVVNQIPNQGWNVQSANQIPSHGWA